MLNRLVTIGHILDSFLQLEFLLPTFFLEGLSFSFFAIESNVDALDTASEILKLLFEIPNLGLFRLKHLLRVAKFTTRMLDAVVKKFDLLFVLASLPVFVLDNLLKNFLVPYEVPNFALAFF
jgi:hypothetical protein